MSIKRRVKELERPLLREKIAVPFILYENWGGKLYDTDGNRCEDMVAEHKRKVREIVKKYDLDPKDMPVSSIVIIMPDDPPDDF